MCAHTTKSDVPARCCTDREVTVRASRSGTLQLKLLVQSRRGAPLGADLLWPQERARLVCHLRQQLPLLRSLSMQVALGKGRPPKDAPCSVLWGELCLLQSEPAYLVGPGTFSQVNHHTGAALVSAVTGWLGLMLTRTIISRGLRTVRTGDACQLPACCAYRRQGAACHGRPLLYVRRTRTSLGRAVLPVYCT